MNAEPQRMITQVSAEQLPQPSMSSVPQALSLNPATKDDFRQQLTSCLILCAPSGMTQDDRNEWLRTAWATLSDLPPDLLRAGCAEARKFADHPSKIVPIIMKTVDGAMKIRRQFHREQPVPKERRIEPKYVEPDEAARILAEHGFAGVGSKVKREPPREPTEEDYRAMGVTA